jgi:glycosyltransferase involved in cell wall biosynthesis
MNNQTQATNRQTGAANIIAAIPCFNEERCIGSVVLKTKRFVDQVIVIDDGSTDETARIAESAGAVVIRHERNQGKGAAIKTAFEYVKKAGCNALVLLDGDGQHDPAAIPSLLRPVLEGESDIVVGSRFLAKGSNIPGYRRVGQHLLTLVTNLGSRVKLSDSQSGFRAFSRKAINAMSFVESGLSIESEMQFAISKAGLKVAEVPIEVSYFDKAKRSPLGHGVSVLSRVLVLFSLRQPLLLFGIPGLVLLGVGLAIGARVLAIYSATQELAIGYSLGTILLCLAGLLLLFAALMLQAMKELMREYGSRIEGTEQRFSGSGSSGGDAVSQSIRG